MRFDVDQHVSHHRPTRSDEIFDIMGYVMSLVDGQPGIDISGYTLRNYFLENSGGLYDLDGVVVDWLTLPHSEAWYGADSCAGGAASMVGHPGNPLGVQQSVIDAVDVLNAREPDFSWDEFDTDDDGVVDHLVFAHAGVGEEGGGGPEGPKLPRLGGRRRPPPRSKPPGRPLPRRRAPGGGPSR